MDYRADAMWEVGGTGSIESDLGDGVLASEWLSTSLEIDVLRETLEVTFAPLRSYYSVLSNLGASGRKTVIRDGVLFMQVGKADEARDEQ
jgi:hypothetical protein